jgi:hypothetical protein
MYIFLALVVGPGCVFMLYALYQFWLETWRSRHAGSRSHSGPVTVVTAINPVDDENSFRAWEAPVNESVPEGNAATVKFSAAGDRRAQRKMLVTCLQNRVAVLRSETGRVAVRRAAKG